MPHNDNLYSADDSDDESLSDHLSPTDGYFTNRQHPQDMLIPNPSESSSAAMSKQHEAAEADRDDLVGHVAPSRTAMSSLPWSNDLTSSQDLSSVARAQNSSSAQISSLPTSISHEQSPRPGELNGSTYTAPPPAYSPPVHRVAPLHSLNPRDYNTFLNRDLERASDAQRAPESMGNPAEDSSRATTTETSPLLPSTAGRRRGWYSLRRSLMVLGVIVCSLCLLLLTIGLASKGQNGDNHEDPVPVPPTPDSPLPQHGPYCATATVHLPERLEYEFPTGDSLTVLQVGRNSHSSTTGSHVDVVGRITVRRMNESLTVAGNDGGRIAIDQWASHHALGWSSVFDSNLRTLRLEVDRYANSESATLPCMSLDVTIWLPFQATFTALTILTWTLDIRVLDDIEVLVDGDVKMQSLSGSIQYPKLNESSLGFWNPESKNARLDTGTGGIVDKRPQEPGMKSPSTTTRLTTAGLNDDLYVVPIDEQYKQQVWPAHSSGIRGRRQIIKSGSSSIQGTFSLYDVLDISSQSGSVDIAVLPQAIDPRNRHPAVFTTETSSGSIHALFPVYNSDALPLRDYQTRVTSNSGSIKGTYLLGDSAVFQSNSGSIEVTCLPGTGHSYQGSVLQTSGYSGQHKVKLLSPPKHPLREYGSARSEYQNSQNSSPGEIEKVDVHTSQHAQHEDLISSSRTLTLRNLKSTHVSSSGSVHVHYASEWEGQIEARSTSGSVSVGGEGVQITKDNRKNWAYKQISAIKGSDPGHASDAEVHSISGQVRLWIGSGCDDGGWCL